MEEAQAHLGDEVQRLVEDLSAEGLHARSLARVLEGWVCQTTSAVSGEVAHRSASDARLRASAGGGALTGPPAPPLLREAALPLASPAGRLAYFGRHATTFRFASRLFPRDPLERVAGVYAFCRFTDDLVDDTPHLGVAERRARLEEWAHLARAANQGGETGVAFLDQVMGEMRDARVPFRYAGELVEGVAMDLEPPGYDTVEELRGYSFRVASVVGGWLTELFGVHDPWVLDRAFALGHAMQLTNILRDVGEDLAMGRIYLPRNLMGRFGVEPFQLREMVFHAGPLPPGYRGILEHLMEQADADYDLAFRAIPSLPVSFRGPVAVAARTYQAIHGEKRRNGYDNLRLRASTSLFTKARVGSLALFQLLRLSRRPGPGEVPETGTVPAPGESAREEAA